MLRGAVGASQGVLNNPTQGGYGLFQTATGAHALSMKSISAAEEIGAFRGRFWTQVGASPAQPEQTVETPNPVKRLGAAKGGPRAQVQAVAEHSRCPAHLVQYNPTSASAV